MPKKGVKPNAKHTACSAVLSITLLQPQVKQEDGTPASTMKAFIFLKNTHNHSLGDLASLKYRKPINEVKEKFLKLFEAKKTVPQALAIHKSDLEAEYGPEHFQSIVNDRAYMPDARWAYGLYYSCYKKKRDKNAGSEEIVIPEPLSDGGEYEPVAQPVAQQISPDPYQMLSDVFRNVCREIADRCDAAPNYFYAGLQAFVSTYESNCSSNSQLLTALQTFGECCGNTANCRDRNGFQSRNADGLPVFDFGQETEASATAPTTVLHPFAKYSNVCVNPKPRITQTRSSVVQSTALINERDMMSTNTLPVAETHNCVEARTIYTLDTKYEDGTLYQIDNRQNVPANCWVPTEYGIY